MKKIVRVLLITFILVFSLSGCGGQPEDKEGISLVIIAGRHANAYMYTSKDIDKIMPLIKNAFSTYKTEDDTYIGDGEIAIIVPDGEPRRSLIASKGTEIPLWAEENHYDYRDDEVDKLARIVKGFLLSDELMADDEEVDLLGALAEAERIHKSSGRKERHTVILDTGVSTAGGIKMQDMKDFMEKSAEELVKNINVPDMSQTNVTFIGLGNVGGNQVDYRTAETDFEKRFEKFWVAVLKKGNAQFDEATIMSAQSAAEGVEPMRFYEDGTGYPKVTSVVFVKPEVEEQIVNEKTEITLKPATISTTALNFKPDSIEFGDQDEALRILADYETSLKTYINANPENKIYIVGSIAKDKDILAKYPTEGVCKKHAISQGRAQKIADTFVKNYGIQAENLVVVDVGTSDVSWREQGEFAIENGEITFNKDKQEKNRVVMIIPDCNKDLIDELRSKGFIQ